MNKRLLALVLIPYAALHSSPAHYLDQAVIALKSKNESEAKSLLIQGHERYPTDTRIIAQLASLRYMLQEFPQAVADFEKLAGLNPDNNTLYNLATSYCKIGRFEDAIKPLEKVLERLPNEPSVHGALLKLYARTKQWRKTEAIVKPSLWWFDENIYGKTVLLDLDKEGNGLGDSIQWIRYARYLAQAGARVIARVQKPLVPLFSRCPYITAVITTDDPTPSYDKKFDICIVSLMCKSKNRIAMQVPESSYLTADPELIKEWGNRLAPDKKYKIGLCWESNFIKNIVTGDISPSPRAISLEELKPIALDGISFYSVQRFSSAATPFAINQFDGDFDESHGRFMDTAAVIMNCDLIISVDTSIAHLAGALGKPVWLLLNCESDYRWFLHEARSYWYPSMRIFRQTEFKNWAPVVAQVKTELEKLVLHR